MSTKQSEQTKEKIINTAIGLFCQKGLSATSLNMICAKSCVTKGALYHHFADKEHLTKECIEYYSRKLEEDEEKAISVGGDDPLQKVYGYIDFYIQQFKSPQYVQSNLIGSLLHEISKSYPRLRITARRAIKKRERRLSRILGDAAQKHKKEIDAHTLSIYTITVIEGSLAFYKASPDPFIGVKNLELLKSHLHYLLKKTTK